MAQSPVNSEYLSELERSYGLPTGILDALRFIESRRDPAAVSPKGALGEFQIRPSTATQPGFGVRPGDPKNPRENARLGAEYLSAMIREFNSLPAALAAYNAGPERTRTGTIPPETRDFVAAVQSRMTESDIDYSIFPELRAKPQAPTLPPTAAVQPEPTGPDIDPTIFPEMFDERGALRKPPPEALPARELSAQPSFAERLGGRIATETLGSGIGGVAGLAIGGALTRNPAGAAAGALLGRYAGGAIGSLASEFFDPSDDPGIQATLAGLFSTLGTAGFRAMLAEFGPMGREMVELAAKHGVVAPPGAVLKSRWSRDMQTVGEASMVTGGWVEQMRKNFAEVVGKEIQHTIGNINTFKGYEASLWKLLDASGLKLAQTPIASTVEALETLAKKTIVDVPDSASKLLARVRANTSPQGTLSWEEAKRARTWLLEMERNVFEESPSAALEIRTVREGLENVMETTARKLPGDMYAVWKTANEFTKMRKNGELVAWMMQRASKVNAPTETAPTRLITMLNSEFAERELPKQMRENLLKLAHLMATAESKGSGAFAFTVRAGQVAASVALVSAKGGAGEMAARGFMTIIIAPSVLSWLVSGKVPTTILYKLAAAQPGTKEAISATGSLLALLHKEGVISKDRYAEGLAQLSEVRGTSPQSMLRMRLREEQERAEGR